MKKKKSKVSRSSQNQPQTRISKLQKYELPLKLLVLALMVISALCVILIPWSDAEVTLVSTENLSYVRAKVLSVEEESLDYDSMETDRLVGTQEITVEILGGELKGEVVEVTNYMTRSINVYCTEGKIITLCVDLPDNAEPNYTVFNYSRGLQILGLILVFCAIVVLVGRKTGLWSLLGLIYTVIMIIFFLVKAIFSGWNSVLWTIITILITACASLFLICGPTKKMITSLCGTLGGTLTSALFYVICSNILHISGYNLDEVETLLMIDSSTGMSLIGLILCAVLITSYGAIMDVAVSISSSLAEIHTLRPELPGKDMFRSGLNIGRDMIGTMVNTLILAYAGEALITMILLMGYGYGWGMLLNSDYLAMEIAQGLSATVGVVLTVPGGSLFCSWMYTRGQGKLKKEKNAAAAGGKAVQTARSGSSK